MPDLLAGPRNPVTSATILAVMENPSEHGTGVEAELSIGATLPVFLLGGTPEAGAIVLGLEAAAFARFALQVLQREMAAPDWLFSVPLVLHQRHGWTRLRFYHASSHMGDEYSRRFGDPGVDFSRDGLEVMLLRRGWEILETWGSIRYGYNVKPEDDGRWVLRVGSQVQDKLEDGLFRPFLALDLEWDEAAGMQPRLEARAGTSLPEVGGRRAIRLSVVALTGPTPLGQFRFRPTTQIGLSLQGTL